MRTPNDPTPDENRQWVQGLKDISGTFTGLLGDDIIGLARHDEPQMMYFYGPDPKVTGSWWRHRFYLVRELLFRGSRWLPEMPYPTAVIASGPAHITYDEPYESEDGATVITGSFTKTGEWKVDE